MNSEKSVPGDGRRQRTLSIQVTSDTIDAIDLAINKNRILRRLGYTVDAKPRPAIESLLIDTLEEALTMLQPVFSCTTMDVQRIHRPNISLSGGSDASVTLTSDVLCRALAPCHQAIIFICSIGQGLEDSVTQMMRRGQTLKASILDAIGSEAAERTADYVEKTAGRSAEAAGAGITLRFSPGYCDWDISQQRLIFGLFDSGTIGVKLTEECLMIPRKSVSGIIGVGWADAKHLRVSPCRSCDRRDCDHRR